jgi:hypothetical protein
MTAVVLVMRWYPPYPGNRVMRSCVATRPTWHLQT